MPTVNGIQVTDSGDGQTFLDSTGTPYDVTELDNGGGSGLNWQNVFNSALNAFGTVSNNPLVTSPANNSLKPKQQLQLAQLNAQTAAANAQAKTKTWTTLALIGGGILALALIGFALFRRK